MKNLLLSFVLIITFQNSFGQNPLKPYPQGLNFAGCIKPNNVTQAQMNASIQSLYTAYKSKYLEQSPDVLGQYYMNATGNPPSLVDATVSEQQGYAMIIMALMAGYDANAKTYYDGMYKLYARFRSSGNNNFMSWKITKNGNTTVGGQSSAADGDLDIAYSLLLAHDQWGGGPAGTSVTYLAEAKRMINAFKGNQGVVSSSTNRILLGDWVSNQLNTRSSDWMVDHMRAYKNATGDAFWSNVENEVYNCISDLTGPGKPGANTGLVSDFANNDPATPDVSGGGTGENYADKYSWNGCRYPWRMAMGYQHYGAPQAKSAMNKLLDWATGNPTGGDPQNFKAGYELNGTALVNYSGIAFVAPITLAATVDTKYQGFLNKGWGELTTLSGNDAYNDAIRILCMLSISGNWWVPGSTTLATSKNTFLDDKIISMYPNPSKSEVTIAFVSEENGTASLNLINNQGRKVLTTSNPIAIGKNAFKFDVRSLPKGIYFCEISSNNSKLVKELLVQ